MVSATFPQLPSTKVQSSADRRQLSRQHLARRNQFKSGQVVMWVPRKPSAKKHYAEQRFRPRKRGPFKILQQLPYNKFLAVSNQGQQVTLPGWELVPAATSCPMLGATVERTADLGPAVEQHGEHPVQCKAVAGPSVEQHREWPSTQSPWVVEGAVSTWPRHNRFVTTPFAPKVSVGFKVNSVSSGKSKAAASVSFSPNPVCSSLEAVKYKPTLDQVAHKLFAVQFLDRLQHKAVAACSVSPTWDLSGAVQSLDFPETGLLDAEAFCPTLFFHNSSLPKKLF